MAHETDMLEDDAEALKARRADLYAFMQEVTAAAVMLPRPETFHEAERMVRVIATADHMVQQFDLSWSADVIPAKPPTPAGMRKAMRDLADHVMATVKTFPMPGNAITSLHALRYAKACDRMLTQLYAPPKPKPAPPRKPRSPEENHRENQRIHRELWEEFSSDPEAKAIRSARRLAAKLAEAGAQLAEASANLPPKPETSDADGSAKATETPAAETENLNPRQDTSEGQDGKNDGPIRTQPDPP